MKRSFAHLRPEATAADKLARLATRLANTPDHLVPMLTPEFLASMTGAPLKMCEYQLTVKRQKMAARDAG